MPMVALCTALQGLGGGAFGRVDNYGRLRRAPPFISFFQLKNCHCHILAGSHYLLLLLTPAPGEGSQEHLWQASFGCPPALVLFWYPRQLFRFIQWMGQLCFCILNRCSTTTPWPYILCGYFPCAYPRDKVFPNVMEFRPKMSLVQSRVSKLLSSCMKPILKCSLFNIFHFDFFIIHKTQRFQKIKVMIHINPGSLIIK